MLIKILAVLAVVVAMQPSEFRVVRTATLAAPPAAVFAQINDLHKWEAWSPWEKIDPAAKKTYEGPSAGTGAAFTWAGQVREALLELTADLKSVTEGAAKKS